MSPGSAIAPAAGLWLSTVPDAVPIGPGTVFTITFVNPALDRSDCAVLTSFPTSFGTAICCGAGGCAGAAGGGVGFAGGGVGFAGGGVGCDGCAGGGVDPEATFRV